MQTPSLSQLQPVKRVKPDIVDNGDYLLSTVHSPQRARLKSLTILQLKFLSGL